jgi:uridine kinase (EC 2.7.1.48)
MQAIVFTTPFDGMSVSIVAIAGGSCSGKTTLARRIQARLGESRCALLFQDNYYIDQSSSFREDGGDVNFDHPDALEFSLLKKHLQSLKNGASIDVPVYDFATHSRTTTRFASGLRPLIVVDGTLILYSDLIRSCLDFSVFVDASESLRFERRKVRDTRERGRSLEGVIKQFLTQVKPMHDQFVEPSKAYADFVFDGSSASEESFSALIHRLESL